MRTKVFLLESYPDGRLAKSKSTSSPPFEPPLVKKKNLTLVTSAIPFEGLAKDAPECNKAKQAIGELLSGKLITVETLNKDRYGRTIGRVFADKQNVNRALVEQGHCWVYPKYAKDEELFNLHDSAKESKRGLWQLPEKERVPPWEWRRK